VKLVTFDADGEGRCGVVVGERIIDLAAASEGRLPVSLAAMLGDEDALQQARRLADGAAGDEDLGARFGRALADVQLMAPVPRPGKVVIGHGAAIRLCDASDKADYEVELAFVIGRPARNVSAAAANAHVAGYTVLNDVSARDYQLEKPGGQWTLGKSFDTFCPMGPWLVTPDEVPDPHSLDLQCVLSGETMQSSNTSQMIFTVSQVVEYLSRVLTLETGDVVAMGTPSGVGFTREPPRFLRSGDVVECTVQGIGTLRNPVR